MKLLSICLPSAFSYNSVLMIWLWVCVQKMIDGGTVSNWICVNFSRQVPDDLARAFCQGLAQMCHTSGMVIFVKHIFYNLLSHSHLDVYYLLLAGI